MSTPPGGPGWQQGPDGRWYPPPGGPTGPYPPPGRVPSHGPGFPGGPSYAGPPPGAGGYGAQPPGAQPPGVPPPGVPPRRGAQPGSSTGRIVAIVLGVVVVLVALGGFAVYRLVSGVADKVGGLADGVGTGCAAVATADVDAALGGHYDVIQLGGIGAIATPALDARVLGDAPTCWAVESGSGQDGGRLARIARYSGQDAAARFAAERKAANGTTEDRGGGLSVSSEPYFNKDVPAGDEAFCTAGDVTGSAGVLTRSGQLLVYVSTNAAGEGIGGIPRIGPDADGGIGFATDDANCDLAVRLAAKVH